MPAPPDRDQSTDAQILRATPDDIEESGTIHPITWMAIGGGFIGVAVTLAVIFGFFDHQKNGASTPAADHNSAIVATTEPTKRDTGNWSDKLVDESGNKSTAPTPVHPSATDGKKPWENDPIVPEASRHVNDRTTPRKSLSPEDLYDQVAPSVVTIKVKDDSGAHIATGSGFFVDKSIVEKQYPTTDALKSFVSRETHGGKPTAYAYVLTNYHVIRPAVDADVVLLNGDAGIAWSVCAEDEKADLALLLFTIKTSRATTPISLASDDPRVLATVYAIGSPKGLSGSASEGKVSGFQELSKGVRWLQTTAPISPGSSGGPLLSPDGTLVGVTTLTFKDAQNVNFAIPVSRVHAFLSSEYHSRAIAEGTSIRWHEDQAFYECSFQCEKSTSSAIQNAGQRLVNAREELREGHYAQAIAFARQGAAELPHEFVYLSEYVIGFGCYHLAWESCKNIPVSGPNHSPYAATEQANDALRHLQHATELNADFSPAFEQLVYHYISAHNWPESLAASQKLVKLMPRCAWAYGLRAKSYRQLKQLNPAMDDLKTSIELAPNFGEPRFQLGIILIDAGEYAAAVDSLEAARELKFSLDLVHFNLGKAYQKSGQFERAVSEYLKAKESGFSAGFLCDQEIAKCKEQLR
jgi:S1-C subfamily serine protease